MLLQRGDKVGEFHIERPRYLLGSVNGRLPLAGEYIGEEGYAYSAHQGEVG